MVEAVATQSSPEPVRLLEGMCPDCYGNVVLRMDGRTLYCECEDCGHTEHTSNKQLIAKAYDSSQNYGPKSSRISLRLIGRVLLESYRNGYVLTELGRSIGETLDSVYRGMVDDVAPEEIILLKKEGLIND